VAAFIHRTKNYAWKCDTFTFTQNNGT